MKVLEDFMQYVCYKQHYHHLVALTNERQCRTTWICNFSELRHYVSECEVDQVTYLLQLVYTYSAHVNGCMKLSPFRLQTMAAPPWLATVFPKRFFTARWRGLMNHSIPDLLSYRELPFSIKKQTGTECWLKERVRYITSGRFDLSQGFKESDKICLDWSPLSQSAFKMLAAEECNKLLPNQEGPYRAVGVKDDTWKFF